MKKIAFVLFIIVMVFIGSRLDIFLGLESTMRGDEQFIKQ